MNHTPTPWNKNKPGDKCTCANLPPGRIAAGSMCKFCRNEAEHRAALAKATGGNNA